MKRATTLTTITRIAMITMAMATVILGGCGKDGANPIAPPPPGSGGGNGGYNGGNGTGNGGPPPGSGATDYSGTWQIREYWGDCVGQELEYEITIQQSGNRVLVDGDDVGMRIENDVLIWETSYREDSTYLDRHVVMAIDEEGNLGGVGAGRIGIEGEGECEFQIFLLGERQSRGWGAIGTGRGFDAAMTEVLSNR